MIKRCCVGFAGVWLLVFLVSCVNDMSGTYQAASPIRTLTLTKDGKFDCNRGAGSYSVEGTTIVVMVPIWGRAKGEQSCPGGTTNNENTF
jgi:hypothetical protein